MYYVHTDNLGSIQVITNESGNIEAEYAYTAWGGRIALIESPLGDLGMVRGYTGHEHLEPLGLINMNGRIYDPVLARFLSPDPYVQAPDFTQSFNRYSYCLNNPFKYTDPSGEFFTWSFGNGGFSIGFNLTPIGLPVGGGLNFGWSNGFSMGTYSEVGYRLGGTGFGAGATMSQSFDFNFKHSSFSTTSTVAAYGSFGVFNVSASGSYYYDMTNRQGGFGWGINAGIGLGGNYAGGIGFNVGYGSGGFNYGFGGSYNPWAAIPGNPYLNPNANSEALKRLQNATKDLRERLAYNVPLLTLEANVAYSPILLPEVEILGYSDVVTKNNFASKMEQLEGKPYVSGGVGPNSFDCSGAVIYGIREVANSNFGRYNANDLYKNYSVPAETLTRGSVIFYDYGSDGIINHVTVALGNGLMLHPSSNQGVLQIKPTSYLETYTTVKRSGTIHYRNLNWSLIRNK